MKIGLISCEIQIVSDKVIHCSINESLSSSERQLPVTVSAVGRGSLRSWGLCRSCTGHSGQSSRAGTAVAGQLVSRVQGMARGLPRGAAALPALGTTAESCTVPRGAWAALQGTLRSQAYQVLSSALIFCSS